jgi:hypothetical protein
MNERTGFALMLIDNLVDFILAHGLCPNLAV